MSGVLLNPYRFAGGNDQNTVVLLHCDGSDTSTTITNNAAGGSTTFTANGNAQIDTADSKFGGASVLFDGTGDTVTFNGSGADFSWAGDFTIDWWMKSTSHATEGGAIRRIFGFGTTGTNLEITISSTTGRVSADISTGTIVSSTTDVSDSAWHHIEVSRFGTTMKLFVDGVQEGSAGSVSTTFVGSATSYIGRYQGSAIGHYVGWLDEIRISNGIARHIAGFTPPVNPYS